MLRTRIVPVGSVLRRAWSMPGRSENTPWVSRFNYAVGSFRFALVRRLFVRSAAPDALVKSGRGAARNGDRLPVIARQNPGNQNDLADMVAAMSQRALDRQGNGMRLSPNQHGSADIGWGQAF